MQTAPRRYNMSSITKFVESLVPVSKSEHHKGKTFLLETDNNPFYTPVTIKQIECSSQEEVDKVLREANFAKANPHAHICECLDGHTEETDGKQYAYIVMPLNARSLKQEIEIRAGLEPRNPYSENELFIFLHQLVSAYAFLQKKGIAHRDVTPDNIMLGLNGCARVCHFGYAKELSLTGNTPNTLLGSVPYMSPILRSALIKGSKQLVEHDPFKSDVYSLGITMIQMTALELPEFITQLKELTGHINSYLDSLPYSTEWVQVLKLMTTLQEENRLDFSQLLHAIFKDRQPSELVPLVHSEEEIQPAFACSYSEDVHFEVKAGLHPVPVSTMNTEEVPCILTLQAASRDSLDLVLLVDQSGSMSGRPMEVIQQFLLNGLLPLLGPADRVCVVGFSDNVVMRWPLRACTEAGKKDLKRVMQGLENFDESSLAEGLQTSINVLQQRNLKNTAALVLLFTDGHVNSDSTSEESIRSSIEASDCLKLLCFGLDGDKTHDAAFLQRMAAAGNGTYYNLIAGREVEVLNAAFPALQPVAHNLTVALQPVPGIGVSMPLKLYKRDGATYDGTPTLLKNQQETLAFLLKLKEQRLPSCQQCSLLKFTVSFIDCAGQQKNHCYAPQFEVVNSESSQPARVATVFECWLPVKGKQYLNNAHELRDRGALSAAKERLKKGIQELRDSGFAEKPGVKEVLERMQTELGN